MQAISSGRSPIVADRPLSPATRRRLGRPLPHQLADRTWAHLRVAGPYGSPPILTAPCDAVVLPGISTRFQVLCRSQR